MFCRTCHAALSLSCISDLLLASFEFFLFFTSCLMTTPCQWFKLVTGFVLVTMVAQTGVCSLWKNKIFLSCHTYVTCAWTVCVLHLSSNAASRRPMISSIRLQFVKMQLFYSVQTQSENPWKCHSKLDIWPAKKQDQQNILLKTVNYIFYSCKPLVAAGECL